MRVLFFSPYFYPYTSGLTTYPLTLLTHLAKKHEFTVLTFPHKEGLAKKETINGFTVVRLPYSFRISKGFISPQSLWYFFSYASYADVVILNTPNVEGMWLAIAAKILRKKIVAIFHCQVTLGNGLIARCIEMILNAAVYVQLLFSDQIVGYTSDYVTHSDVARLFGAKIVNHFPPVIPLPSPTHPKFKRIQEKQMVIGFAGRTAREKGIEYLIEAMSILAQQGFRCQLLIAGPSGSEVAGEQNYYDRILELLKTYDISYRFLGNLGGEKFAEFYEAIDVLVLPSINKTEAFGMVQVEAMRAGVPVVASNLPGVRVPIQQTGMGITVEPKNAREIATAIQEIATHRSKYTNPALIKKTHEIFDINKVYDFYDGLLEKLSPKK